MPKEAHTKAAEHHENAAKNEPEARQNITARAITPRASEEFDQGPEPCQDGPGTFRKQPTARARAINNQR